MNNNIESLFSTLLTVTFSHYSVHEYVERLENFLINYMPITYIRLCIYDGQKVTKLASYPSYKDPSPETLIIPKDVIEEIASDPNYLLPYLSARILPRDAGAYSEKLERLLHKQEASTIFIPLEYDRKSFTILYLAISNLGKDVYTAEQLEICNILRHPLAHAVARILLYQNRIIPLNANLPAEKNASRQEGGLVASNFNKAPAFSTLEEKNIEYINEVLAYTKGRVGGKKGAAHILGLNISTLWSKIRKYNIPVAPYKKK